MGKHPERAAVLRCVLATLSAATALAQEKPLPRILLLGDWIYGGYHNMGNAPFRLMIGDAFAKGMVKLMKKQE